MDENSQNNDLQNQNQVQAPEPAQAQPPQQVVTPQKSNKNLLLGALIGVGILLLALIIVVVMLLTKKDSTSTDTSAPAQSSQSSQKPKSDAPKKVVLMTVPTINEKLELIIYKPTQNATNTTINFAVRNKCAGCEGYTSASTISSGFDSTKNSYLIDENMGKKFTTIKDQDNNVLATPNCSVALKSGESIDCFVAFSKVSSGSTVSWVFGNTRVDGIKVE